jgi:hypothetical protein
MTINIEWQDQFGRWHHYQTKHNQADAWFGIILVPGLLERSPNQ